MVYIPPFRFISPDVGVYLYYAGRDRKFMRTSQLEGKVFLDLPGFLANQDTFGSEDRTIQALNRADAVKRFLRDPANRPGPRPLNEYPTTIPTVEGKADRGFSADLGNIRTMFLDINPGDIVIMTPNNHYDNLLVGEIISSWSAENVMRIAEYGDHTLPYLPVKWLSHSLSRRDFPSEVARRLQNRKAITKIDPDYYESIFRFLYTAYSWGNTSKLDIFGPGYDSSDPTSNVEASFLVKYAVAYYSAFINGNIDKFNELTIEEAANHYFDRAIAIQIAQAFGSPGGYVTKLIGSGAALGVALILGVALGSEAQTPEQAQQAATEHATAVHQEHHGRIDVDLPGLGNSMRAGNTQQLRERYGRAARAKIGMTLAGVRPPELQAREGVQREP